MLPNFGDGCPVIRDVPPGIVTLMVKRIPDHYAGLADGFAIIPMNQP
jgi:hypothetical protein